MATSSCNKLGTEFGELTLQPPVDEDSDDGECSLRSPNVRAYVASFEQYRQHRQLCRTDDVAKYQPRYHQRPQPPCKTTTAVLKARHLRAASEDLSRSWKSTDQSEVAVTSISVAELKVALLNSTNLSSDQNRSGRDRSEDDICLREPTLRCQERNVPATVECDENEIDEQNWNGTEHTPSSITVIPDTAVDRSLRHSSSEIERDKQHSATDGGVDSTDSTGDDVGYFSLPVRRSDRNKHQTARSSSSKSWHLDHNSATVDDDEVEPPLKYNSDSAGSLSPGLRGVWKNRGRCRQADVSSSFGSCASEDEQCHGLDINASSQIVSGCSDCAVPDNYPPSSDGTAYSQHSDEVAVEDSQEVNAEDDPVLPQRSSVPLAKLEPGRLSEMMTASFGRCDEVLCRAVGAVNSYRTSLNYVSSFYPESRLIRPLAFDLARPCQLDATSTGVQFLTLEAVRVISDFRFSSTQIFAASKARSWHNIVTEQRPFFISNTFLY